MPERKVVEASEAPKAVGPYSHAISHGGVLFCSGQVPLDPGTGELVEDGIGEQTERCLRNLEAVCAAAGTRLSRALVMTVYTTELGAGSEINAAYGEFFGDPKPARTTVGSVLAGIKVEIDVVAGRV